MRLRAPSTRRLGALLVALLGMGAAVGCGNDRDAGALRFQLVLCELDGAPPTEGLAIERLETKHMSGTRLPAAAVAGPPGLFEVPGAPSGLYYVHMPAGWGQLVLNTLPRMEVGGRPALCRVGRSHTFYLDSHQRGRLLGDVWGVRKAEASGAPGLVLPLEVQRDPSGVTILRIPAAHWTGPIALMGRYADGGLTELVLTELKEHGRPIYRELDPEPLAPLRVSIASPEPLPDDALWVHVSVEGLPIEDLQQQPVRGGSASFRGVPAAGSGVAVSVGDGPEAVQIHLGPGGWLTEGEVRVHAPMLAPVAVVLEGVLAGPALRVQARRAGGDSFGLVVVAAAGEPAVTSVRLAAGRWTLLIDDGTRMQWRSIEIDGAGEVTTLPVSPPEEPAIVKGVLTMGDGRRLLWQREEAGQLVLGQGFVLRAGPGGRYRGRLPAGNYQLVVEDLNGRPGKPRRVVLTAGMQFSLPLEER